MGESLTEQYRVRDESLWVVTSFLKEEILKVLEEQASANSVPAAAVIQRMQALSGITGHKASVGCLPSLLLKIRA